MSYYVLKGPTIGSINAGRAKIKTHSDTLFKRTNAGAEPEQIRLIGTPFKYNSNCTYKHEYNVEMATVQELFR
jgi:hypothetical protein